MSLDPRRGRPTVYLTEADPSASVQLDSGWLAIDHDSTWAAPERQVAGPQTVLAVMWQGPDAWVMEQLALGLAESEPPAEAETAAIVWQFV